MSNVDYLSLMEQKPGEDKFYGYLRAMEFVQIDPEDGWSCEVFATFHYGDEEYGVRVPNDTSLYNQLRDVLDKNLLHVLHLSGEWPYGKISVKRNEDGSWLVIGQE